jgi:hypothetical protein
MVGLIENIILLSDFTTVSDRHQQFGGATAGAHSLNALDDVVKALNDLSEHSVLAIQPRGSNQGDEELRPVGVSTSIGHAKKTRGVVLDGEVLIVKLVTVDALAASTITTGKVTSLTHEVSDNTVELRALVAKALLASAQSAEVLSTLRSDILVELHHNATLVLSIDICDTFKYKNQ